MMHFVNINSHPITRATLPLITFISTQDPHSLRLWCPRQSTEVGQQPEESLQRRLQQVRLQLRPQERRQPDQGLAAVRTHLYRGSKYQNMLNNTT